MATMTILVVVLLGFITITQACLCPLPLSGQDLFRYAYHQAGTVVKAKVLKEKVDAPCENPPCLCVSPPCPASDGLGGKRIYTFRLLRTFKGTPPSKKFMAETVLDPVRCGIRLQVGTIYMLNMSGGSPSYFLWLCQFSKPWAQVSAEQRRFLWMCRKPEPPKFCSLAPAFVSSSE